MPELVRIGELSKAVNLHINTLRRLADQAEIPVTTTSGGHRLFDVAAVLSALEMRSQAKHPSYVTGAQTIQAISPPTWQNEYPLNNLNEDLVFQELKKDLGLDMSCGAADILPYAFTEMLNNAIDHSEGAVAKIRFWRNSQFWAFDIVDDGVGVFRKISDNFNLAGPIESIGELSKGKRTTAAQGHTGEGIFFTSKVVDRFELSANGLEWDVDNSLSDFTIMYRQMDRGYFQAVLD